MESQNDRLVRTEPELRNQIEWAEGKLIDTFRKYQLIKVCTANHKRAGHSRNCDLINPLRMSKNQTNKTNHSENNQRQDARKFTTRADINRG